MIDPVLIGERLSEARRSRRLTQQQVADELGVARTTIVAMEKGDRRPRAWELVALARLYAQPIRDLVRQESQTPRPDFLVQFRAVRGAAIGNDVKREEDVRRFERFCQWYVEAEELLGAPLARRYPDLYDVSNTPADRAAEEVATSERNRLGLGDGPVGDLWGLLETDIGLRVFALEMRDTQVAGMFLYTEEFGGCIAVNANQPEERRRMSAVHEYAHFLTHRLRPEITILNSSKRVPESERFADAFSRYFLMPSMGLSRRFEAIRRAKRSPITPGDVLALSHLFQVSFRAMTWRLEELKLLPSGTWDRLRDLGFRPSEAREIMEISAHNLGLSLLPLRYEALVIQAYERGDLTEIQLAERLGTDLIGARERVSVLTTETQPSVGGEWEQIPLDLSTELVASR